MKNISILLNDFLFRLLLLFTLMITGMITGSGMAQEPLDFDTKFKTVVSPFMESTVAVYGQFDGVGSITLEYAKFPNDTSNNTIVIVNGLRETFTKYAEIIYDFHSLGFSVYTYDHRGQGQSQRLLENSKKSYIDFFDNFASDLHTFLFDVVLPENRQGNVFLLGHSMGGAIVSLYLEKYNHDHIRGAILSSPMLGIQTPYYDWVSTGLTSVNVYFGQREEYAVGQEDNKPLGSYMENRLTTSLDRFEKIKSLKKTFPGHFLGGVTYGWLEESYFAMEYIRQNSGRIYVPILLLQAGQDSLVTLDAQFDFCRNVMKCYLQRFKDAKHEILQEVDPIRDEAFNQIKDFIADPWSLGDINRTRESSTISPIIVF